MKRIKKVLIWMSIVAGAAIGILLVLNAWYVWSTGARLERQLAALRKAGEPVQLSDLTRSPIPPEKNAAVFLRRAADDLDAVAKELGALYPKTNYPTGPLLEADQEKLERLFAAYPNVPSLLEQAAACPDYDPQLDYTLPPSRFLESAMEGLTKRRVTYRVLRARAAWLVSKGRYDEALASTVVGLRLSRHFEREPLMVGYLVTLACKGLAMDGVNYVLQAGTVSPESREALDAELGLHDSMDGYRRAFQSERAYVLSAMREMPGYDVWFMRGFANAGILQTLALMERHLKNSERPYPEIVAEEAVNASAPKAGRSVYSAVVESLKPALNAAREPAERVRAMVRSLRVLNAIQGRPRQNESVPKLSDLGLAAETTTDPYSGQPLKVKRLSNGWTVYSVGRNLVDDGGTFDNHADIGVGPIRPGTGIGRIPEHGRNAGQRRHTPDQRATFRASLGTDADSNVMVPQRLSEN